MKSLSCLAVVTLLGLVTMPQDLVKPLTPPSTQQSEKSSLSLQPISHPKSVLNTKQDRKEADRINADIEAIMEIRRQLGGGVAEQLGNDFSTDITPALVSPSEARPAQDVDKAFKAHLKRQLSSPKNASDDPYEPSSLARQARQPTVAKAFAPKPQLVSNASNPVRSQQLRRAARLLEEAAAMLEEAREFHHADSVRDSAAKLWRAAR